jgi:hypothetical protein
VIFAAIGWLISRSVGTRLVSDCMQSRIAVTSKTRQLCTPSVGHGRAAGVLDARLGCLLRLAAG